MKFSIPAPRAVKGRLKCFDCRRALVMKEGDWHDRGTQQVFLCHLCHKTVQKPGLKLPSSR